MDDLRSETNEQACCSMLRMQDDFAKSGTSETKSKQSDKNSMEVFVASIFLEASNAP